MQGFTPLIAAQDMELLSVKSISQIPCFGANIYKYFKGF